MLKYTDEEFKIAYMHYRFCEHEDKYARLAADVIEETANVNELKKLEMQILAHYGGENQIEKFYEEMQEAEQALKKLVECYKSPVSNLDKQLAYIHAVEELADVLVVHDQMQHLLKCEKEIKGWKLVKVVRTLNRIEEEKAIQRGE